MAKSFAKTAGGLLLALCLALQPALASDLLLMGAGARPTGCTPEAFNIGYRTAAVDAASLTTYTFSTQDFGAVPASCDTRIIIVAVHIVATQSVSSMTIGGVSATLAIASGGAAATEIWYANVPTGTTGTVSITLGGASNGLGIGIWRMANPSSATPTATNAAQHVSGVVTLTLTINTGGTAVAGVTARDTTLRTVTWTGTATPTENYEQDCDAQDVCGGAISTATGASRTFIATASAAPATGMWGAAAAWAP